MQDVLCPRSDVGAVLIIIIWNVISLVNFKHIVLAHKQAELHFSDRALETELRKATGATSVRAGSIAAWSFANNKAPQM